MDALLRTNQPRETLDGGGFDAALDVEIVLRHVNLGVTGEGLYCLHRYALCLKLAHESVAARVRRERPDAGDRCNRGGELVAEVRRVARFIPALARPQVRRAVCTQLLYHVAVGYGYRNVTHTSFALRRSDEYRALYLLHRLPYVDARAIRLDVLDFERQQLLRAHTREQQ